MKIIQYKNTHQFVNISFLFYIIIFLFISLSSCEKKELVQEIPSYINVSEVKLMANNQLGGNTHKITDVWLYVNDQFRGVYELPSRIPLLHSDSTNLKFFAGIKDNGISSTRVRYHFYKSYELSLNLIKDSVIDIVPEFRYTDVANIEYENFEGVGTDIDTTINSEIDFQINIENGNHYAYASLSDSFLTFEISTNDFENLPQQTSPVYLELDYMSNHNILAGAYINYTNTVANKELLWITPKEDEWNKIYVNMTKTVSEALGNNSIKFYFNSHRLSDTTKNYWLKIDNIKIIF